VTPSIELAASRAVLGTRGSAHTKGNPHTTYHGRRIGPRSRRSTSDHPHTAACSCPDKPTVDARRHTARAIDQPPQARRPSAPSLTTRPKEWKVTTSTARATTLDGANQPDWPANPSIPSVGSRNWTYGTAKNRPIPAASPTRETNATRRSSGGRRATHQTSSMMSGNSAVTLMSAASVRTATAADSRLDTSNAYALTIASATSRSLWPLAAAWNSTTGLAPNAASAKAVRSGQSRRTTQTITPQVERLAAIEMNRYASTASIGLGRILDNSAENDVHAGP